MCVLNCETISFNLGQVDQLLWTEIYRPKHWITYVGHQTKPVRRLNSWFSLWSTKLNARRTKKNSAQGRKRRRNQDDDDDDFVEQSSKQ